MKYLARSGRVFGPYNDADFASMKNQGELDRFSWIWSETKNAWEPLDLPPPPLVLETKSAPELPPAREMPAAPPSTPPARPARPAAPQPPAHNPPPLSRKFNQGIEAVCHDFHQVISGVLDTISESGCSVIAKESSSSPAFGRKSHLLLSLLDPSTGNSMNVKAKLASASREGGKWHYRLQWESCPEILVA